MHHAEHDVGAAGSKRGKADQKGHHQHHAVSGLKSKHQPLFQKIGGNRDGRHR
jgi:hypothetical protein